MTEGSKCFIPFDSDVSKIEIPSCFTFPFYYQPHLLSQIASEQLQRMIQSNNWKHNFGLDKNASGLVIGKMFGVLVVRSQYGELGFLAGFSGKIADENHHDRFVPPVFDILEKDGFFKDEEAVINEINSQIDNLASNPDYVEILENLSNNRSISEREMKAFRSDLKQGKMERKKLREEARLKLIDHDFEALNQELSVESVNHQIAYKRFAQSWGEKLDKLEKGVNVFRHKIEELKAERKRRSAELQNRLFDSYRFINANGDWRSLLSIFHFTEQQLPPAGAGECAAPKLLQYAYLNSLEPIAMAEFWWGASPKSDVRRHKHYYPACRGKCEPILGHMLKGLQVDSNPMLEDSTETKQLEVIYEDQFLLAINKPAEFLSVPGKTIKDSVYTRLKAKYPLVTGPLIVHRLDMSTSGIMLIAKSKEVHKQLQHQFEQRTIKKRYTALLDGKLTEGSGEINLPLRVDLDDRPRQLVCYEYGKPSKTNWELLEANRDQCRVHFYPHTGRTHQLRVHAAHNAGLNTPILGDDLYGKVSDRLYLHADRIEFIHPNTRHSMRIDCPPPF